MSKNVNDIQNKIIKEWEEAFPQLVLLSKFKFCKIVGPLVIGIELIKLPRVEKYRPHFVIYSLWGSKVGADLKTSLSSPVILQEYYNKKGLQFSIPYDKSSDYFVEVLESIKNQRGLPFDRDLQLNELLYFIDEYSKTTSSSIAPYSFLQAAIQKVKVQVALYVDAKKAQEILEQIKLKKWDVNYFKACQVDLNMWLQDLQETINNREIFLSQIKNNKISDKLKHLIKSELKD